MLTPSNRRILAYLREYTDGEGNTEIVLCVANVSRAAQAAELELSAYADKVPVEMLGGSAFPPIGQLPFLLTLPPYGFYWFLLASRDRMPSWHIEPSEGLPELTTLVLRKRMEELLDAPSSETLETTILPQYLPKRRWFAGKQGPIDQVRLNYGVRLATATTPVLLSELQVHSEGVVQHYQLPFGLLPEEQINSALPQQLALSRVRRGRQVGLITDAFVLEPFIRAVLSNCQARTRLPCGTGELRFDCTEQLASLALNEESEVRYLSAEQSNSSVVVGGSLVLKLIRRVNPGIHPELEMSAYLTAAGFANISPLLGWVSRVDDQGTPHLLMIAQGYLNNQGDAWDWTQNTWSAPCATRWSRPASSPRRTPTPWWNSQALPRCWASDWARCTCCWPHPVMTRLSRRAPAPPRTAPAGARKSARNWTTPWTCWPGTATAWTLTARPWSTTWRNNARAWPSTSTPWPARPKAVC